MSVNARSNDKVRMFQANAYEQHDLEEDETSSAWTVAGRVSVDSSGPDQRSRQRVDLVGVLDPGGQATASQLAVVLQHADELRVRDAGRYATDSRHKHVLHRQEHHVTGHGHNAGDRRARHHVPRTRAVRRVITIRVHRTRDEELGRVAPIGQYREAVSADESVSAQP